MLLYGKETARADYVAASAGIPNGNWINEGSVYVGGAHLSRAKKKNHLTLVQTGRR